MMNLLNDSLKYINDQYTGQSPQIGIILGTGLGALVNDVKIAHEIPYEQIPHFPTSTVESHKGKLIFGELSGKRVVIMQGRFHHYEGYTMKQVTFPVRILKMLGIEKLIISNAAGGLNEKFQLSDLMVINDHISLLPENPLTGQNLDELGGRFPDMSEPYNELMIGQAMEIGKELGLRIHEGVYVGVTGPNLETKAEYKYLKIIGADAVGMSTVPENIVARQMDLPCFAISVITDICYGEIEKVTIEKVIAAAMKAEPGMTAIIKELISRQ
jgi:purine-nucleoside phosphorylase